VQSHKSLGRGFNLVVRVRCWHAGDVGLNPWLRDRLYTFGCVPPAP
jgi:hypothetical protein